MVEDLSGTRVLAATVLVNLGLAGVIGAWASSLWLRAAASPWALLARRRSWRALGAALAFTAIADALLLWLQAADMAQVPMTTAWAMLPTVVLETYVGRAWLGGMSSLLVVLVASRLSDPDHAAARLAGIAIGISAFVYSRAAVSHAGDFGLASLQLLVESAHLWAISLWLGVVGIAVVAVLSRPTAGTALEWTDIGDWIRALSAAATGALLVIVGTGLFNTWRGVGSITNLVVSDYGRTLLVKVALVAIAVALGALNRFQAMPRLLAALRSTVQPIAQVQRFVNVLRIEALVLLAALIAAAVLSSSPLPPATVIQSQ